jgi:WD40 repeat protein/uncharacterized caspase-like protein
MSITNNSRKKHLQFRQSHAIVIGVDFYPRFNNHLRTAVNDATQIAGLLAARQGFDNVLLITNPVKAEIMALLDWLQNPERPEQFPFPDLVPDAGFASRSRSGWPELPADEAEGRAPQPNPWSIDPAQDSILFYYAGHGIPGVIEGGPAGYLVPSDGHNDMSQNTTLIEMDAVYTALRKLGCHHTLLILDCCFSGKFRFSHSSRFEAGNDVTPLYRQRFLRYKNGRAWQVLTSAASDQTAADAASWLGIRDHSPFAATLIEALEGAADLPLDGKRKGDGVITAAELYLYIRQKVNVIIEAGERKPQNPGLFPMEDHRGGEFIFLNADFNLEKLLDRPVQNPYKGLLSYEPEDAQWFYGREPEVAEISEKLRHYPIAIITGPSAVGKSSLAKAGIFPQLQEKYGFELLKLRPGAHPWKGEEVKVSQKMPDGSKQETHSHYSGLRALCQSQAEEGFSATTSFWDICGVLDPAESTKKRLLLIDQYEAFFTENRNADEQDTFEEALKILLDFASKSRIDDPGCLRIIITIRSDFEWLLEASDFGKHLLRKDGGAFYDFYRLHPMVTDQLRTALLGPADEEIFEFEGSLAEQILTDLNYSPAALPLLSFSMQRLFQLTIDKGETDELGDPKRVFTWHLYNDEQEGLGGVTGALRGIADQLYRSLDKSEQSAVRGNEGVLDLSSLMPRSAPPPTPLQLTMKKIMLRLVRPGEGLPTRRRVYHTSEDQADFWSELDYPDDEEDKMVEEVLAKLEDANLIVRGRDLSNGQPYIELAHDSLITEWPRCRQWIQDFGQENILLQRQLWQAVLDQKKQLARKENEERGIDPQTVIKPESLSSNVSALWDRNPKLIQTIDSIMTAAANQLAGRDSHSFHRAIDLIKTELQGRDLDNFNTLLNEWDLTGRSPNLDAFVLSGASGKLLKVFLEHGNHWLNQQEKRFIEESWEKRIADISQLKKERDEAKASYWATKALLLEQQNPTTAFNLAMAAYKLMPNEVSINALYTITSNPDNSYYRAVFECEHQDPSALAISADGALLLIGWEKGDLFLADPSGKIIEHFASSGQPMTAVVFSKDTQLFAGATADGVIRVWKREEKKVVTTIKILGKAHSITDLAFSEDNSRLLSAGLDRRVLLWELTAGEIEHPLQQFPHPFQSKYYDLGWLSRWFEDIGRRDKIHNNAVSKVAFYGEKILAGYQGGTIRIWSLDGRIEDTFEVVEKELARDGFGEVPGLKAWDGLNRLIDTSRRDNPDKVMALFSEQAGVITAGFKNGKVIRFFLGETSEMSNPNTKKEKQLPTPVSAMALNLDGYIFKAHESGLLSSLSLGDDQLPLKLRGHTGEVRLLATPLLTTRSERILSGSQDQTVKLWEYNLMQADNYFYQKMPTVTSVVYSDSGQYLVAGYDSGEFYIIDIERPDAPVRQPLKRVIGHMYPATEEKAVPIIQVAFAKGDKALFVNEKGYVLAIECRSESPEAKIIFDPYPAQKKGHFLLPNKIAFSKDGRYMFTAPKHDPILYIKDLQTGKDKKVDNPESGYTYIRAIAIDSIEDKKIFVAGFEYVFRLWEMEGYRKAKPMGGNKVNERFGQITAVAISAEKQKVLLGLEVGGILIYDFSTGSVKLRKAWTAHSAKINEIRFSPGGRKIISCGDETVKYWDLEGRLIQVFRANDTRSNFGQREVDLNAVSAAMSPNERFVFAGIGSVHPRLFRTYEEAWEKGLIYKFNEQERKHYGIDFEY